MQTPLPFDYSIKRSRRKTLGLYVKEGEVEVRAPHFVPDYEIHSWVIEKTDWVLEQLNIQYKQANEKPDISQQGKFLFLGKERKIELIHGKPAIYEKDDHLIIAHHARTNIQKLFEQWIRTEAELYLTDQCYYWADLMNLAERINDISFKKTRSKWGHCTHDGKLQFNWLTIMSPPEVIDYLLIHELSHLVHLNHSRDFWQLVAQFCPDYKIQKAWLDKNGHKIWL